MLPLKKILCPVDFSEPSRLALSAAAELAAQFDAELIVLHVAPEVPVVGPGIANPIGQMSAGFDVESYQREIFEASQKELEGLIQNSVPAGRQARAMTSVGQAASEIVDQARELGVDLVVIATHGRTGWRHLVFGSVAEQVVRLSDPPVLTIRAPRDNEGGMEA